VAQVNVDVYTRIHNGSLQKGVEQIRVEATRGGRDAGDLFANNFATAVEKGAPRVTRSFDELTKSTDRIRQAEERLKAAWASNDRDRVIAATNKLAQAHRNAATESERFARAQRNLSGSLSGQFSDGAREVESFTSKLAALGTAARGAGPALLAVGAPAVAAGIGQVAGVAASASQSLLLLPGAATAAGAAFGTLKLATQGFSDALDNLDDTDKFVELLDKLSPSARAAALAIRSIKPAWDQLQQSAQESFFAGLAPQITQLSQTLLPELRGLTTGIATGLNSALSGVLAQIQSPQGLATIHTIVQNIVTAFQNLGPAAAPLTQALATLTQAGSNALPAIATAATNAAVAFNAFIDNASRSGELDTWLAQGLNTLEQIVHVAGSFGDAFMKLAPIGEKVLPDIVTVLDAIAASIPGIVKLAGEMSSPFEDLADVIGFVKDNWDALNTAMSVTPFAAMDNDVLKLTDSMRQMLNPLDAIVSAVKAVGFLFGVTDEGSALDNAQKKLADAQAKAKWGGPGAVTGMPGMPGGPGGPPVDPGRGGNGASRLGAGGGVLGGINIVPSSNAWNSPSNPFGVSGSGSAGAGPGAQDGPVIPRPSTDPISLLQPGQQITASLYQSAQSLIEAQWKVAQDQAILDDLKKRNNVSQQDLQKAENDLIKDRQDAVLAQQRLVEAQQSATDSQLKASKTASDAFGKISAGLDNDLGISRGLPGLADNLVRFIGAIATAPIMGALSQITGGKDASETGSGLIGALFAGSSFASSKPKYPEYTPTTAGPTGPIGSAMPGESPRDFAHRVMMPFWQSQGFQVGDHAADQFGEHQNGALDIMVPSIEEGNKVLQEVLRDPNVYGAIFNNQTYGYGHGSTPQDYSAGHTGDPNQDHTNHVHAWYKPGQAGNLGDGGAPFMDPSMPGVAPTTSSVPFGGQIPIPLPVTIVGVGQIPQIGGAPLGTPASGQGGGPLPGPAPGSGLSADQWNKIAGAEASGDWKANTGNGYSGGLQFSPSTWDQFGGKAYADEAWQATPEQQMDIGNKVFASQGAGAWPTTSANHPDWFAPSAPLGNGPAGPTLGNGPITPPIGGGGSGPGAGVPGLAPPPQSLPGLSSGQITNPGSDPNGWQPQGGSVGAGLGQLLQSGLSSALSAAGAAGDAAGGMGGGSAAAAAAAAIAQLAMQATNRTIKFGGQATGDALGGLFETFSVGGSSLADPMQGWLGRAIGGLVGATPQLPSMAGDRAQQGQLTNPNDKKDAQGQPGQPQGQDAKQGKNGGITIMGDWVNNVPNATAQQLANNLNFASAGGNSRSGG